MQLQFKYHLLILFSFFLIARYKAQINASDTVECNTLISRAEKCTQKQKYDSTAFYLDQAEKKCSSINWTNGLYKTYCGKFNLLFNYIEKPDSARYYVNKVGELGKLTGNKIFIRKSYKMAGVCLEKKAKFADAMEQFYKGLEISESLDNKLMIAADHKSIGIQMAYLKNTKGALGEYQIAYDIETALQDTIALLSTLYIMGNAYSQLPDLKKALEFHERRLKICEFKKWDDCIYPAYEEISALLCTNRVYKKALDYAMKAYTYFKRMGFKSNIANIDNKIVSCLHNLNRSKECEPFILEQRQLAIETGNKAQLLNNYRAYADFFEKTNNPAKATEYYKEYISKADSIYRTTTAEQMAEMSKKYETEKKDKEIAIKEIEIHKQQAESRAKSNQRNIFIAAFCVLFILIFFILRGYQLKRKANIEISRQKEVIEEKQKEIIASIKYAKRIQSSLMSNEKYIEKNMERLNKKT